MIEVNIVKIEINIRKVIENINIRKADNIIGSY